ncbi:MAG: phosphatase PAP2 family protein [Gaiellaceae bacterium]
MDWRIYHAIYGVSLHHHWVGSLFSGIETASIPVMVVATVALWLLSRPGGDRKWKLASTFALASAALALGVNRAIASLVWHRDRPYLTHPISHPWSNTRDASFPSDHASASFAIAFAVLMVDTVAGALFLAAALVIAAGRLFIGAHYPSDVGAGFLVGLASAIVVVKALRPLLSRLVHLVERVTDPILAPLWRLTAK